MSAKSEQAVRKFGKGFNCSQAVLSVYAEEFGLCRETALKIACGFGGGMGRMALTCGVVTGAFMVIGLKYGNVDANETFECKNKNIPFRKRCLLSWVCGCK